MKRTPQEKELEMVNIVQYLPMTDVRLSEIRKHSYNGEI